MTQNNDTYKQYVYTFQTLILLYEWNMTRIDDLSPDNDDHTVINSWMLFQVIQT